MSFADYTSLKTAIATDWLHRSDMTSQVDDFIDLFESDFNSSMRVRQMETTTATSSTAGQLLHPSGWLGWKELRLTTASHTYNLEPVTDEIAVLATVGEGTTSIPRYYKVKGTKTNLYPTASAITINATYYEGVALATTNWLLTAYPGAYLYGSLLQATAAIGDDPRVPLWHQAYEGILSKIRADSRKGEWSGQVLQMRTDLRGVA